MSKLDPGLKMLLAYRHLDVPMLEVESAFTFESVEAEPVLARVLLEFEGDLGPVRDAGFQPETVAGDIATGWWPVARVEEAQGLPQIRRLELSRVLHSELDLVVPELRADLLHNATPRRRGAGVLIGIIDSGIDFRHDAFRRADGKSRIVGIWDQRLRPRTNERSPAQFTYGVEYRTADIDGALAVPQTAIVNHKDLKSPSGGFHGTHVAGIAAGDGSAAGGDRPAFTFVGLAPEAELIVVANTRGQAGDERGLGDSADTIDAVRYILELAAERDQPVVINMSQGDNVGPHDGTSLLERGIDNLLRQHERVLVKSAGNEGARQRHASGLLQPGSATSDIQFDVPPETREVVLDLWYPGADRYSARVAAPGGAATSVRAAGSETTPPLVLASGDIVYVDSDLADPANGDNRIFVRLSATAGNTVSPGIWTLTIRADTLADGHWHAWIQRHSSSRFLAPFENRNATISVPGTAREVITVGSFVTRIAGGSPVGDISDFSSLGPTRDARQAPTIAAPGEEVIAPQPVSTGDAYGAMSGTSMATPAVTGIIALMLEKRRNATGADIIAALTSTARSDAFSGAVPNNAWGAGKLDAEAAVAAI